MSARGAMVNFGAQPRRPPPWRAPLACPSPKTPWGRDDPNSAWWWIPAFCDDARPAPRVVRGGGTARQAPGWGARAGAGSPAGIGAFGSRESRLAISSTGDGEPLFGLD